MILGTVLAVDALARAGLRSLLALLRLLVVLGVSPLGFVMVHALENRFPPWDDTRGAPTGFIILGGAVDPELSAAHANAGARCGCRAPHHGCRTRAPLSGREVRL